VPRRAPRGVIWTGGRVVAAACRILEMNLER
jgi:hypothetical protein